MRSALTTSAILYGLALGNPIIQRQQLDLDAWEAAATLASTAAPPIGDAAPQETISYDPVAIQSAVVAQVTAAPVAEATDGAAAVIAKRAATTCTTRTFHGPKVTSPADTPLPFLRGIPSGYNVVQGFVNLQATAQNTNYLTYTSKLSSYDPDTCAQLCDGMAGCNAFVIYNEGVPLVVSTLTQVPDTNVCPGTNTSASATLIKCAFYGQPVTAAQATNTYQFQGKFKVVWAGANAYAKVVPTLDSWNGPVSFGNSSIDAPSRVGFLRSQTFGANVPFDPSQCAASCKAQTLYNAQYGNNSGAACMFFNAFIAYKNGLNGVFTCNYYSVEYDTSVATYTGQADSNGNEFTIGFSYGYYVDLDLPSTCSSLFVSTTTITPMTTITADPITYVRRAVALGIPAGASASAFYSACSAIGITSTVSTTIAPTTTITINPPPATCTQGLEYALYELSRDSSVHVADALGNPEAWFSASIFNGASILGVGVSANIGATQDSAYSTWGSPLSLYGSRTSAPDSQYFAAEHRGYIHLTQTGTYTISSALVDDLLGVWVGTPALGTWTTANANLLGTWNRGAGAGLTYTITVDSTNLNTYIPIRIIWINGGGPYGLDMKITNPSNAVILGLSSAKNHQIVSSCFGSVTSAPEWPTWS
ncbi:hypothetical protein GQ53DRAFT_826543 [Thozetella sp. PMI_491]|nr:hypothetical protein GQ53DRAFT_826543 [Thozetella sp. PMI_491]